MSVVSAVVCLPTMGTWAYIWNEYSVLRWCLSNEFVMFCLTSQAIFALWHHFTGLSADLYTHLEPTSLAKKLGIYMWLAFLLVQCGSRRLYMCQTTLSYFSLRLLGVGKTSIARSIARALNRQVYIKNLFYFCPVNVLGKRIFTQPHKLWALNHILFK